jgi:hypothetical protein
MITKDDIIELPIPKEIVMQEDERLHPDQFSADRDPSQYGFSKMRTLYGAVAERVVADYFGVKDHQVTRRQDFDFRFCGYRYEVKAIYGGARPNISHEATVNTRWKTETKEAFRLQACDYLLFVRMTNDLDFLWIMGQIPRSRFLALSTFVPKGTKLERAPMLKFDMAPALCLQYEYCDPVFKVRFVENESLALNFVRVSNGTSR